MKKILFYSFIIGILFTTCKKYEEGPYISFRSKKARVVGDWELISYCRVDVDAGITTMFDTLSSHWGYTPPSPCTQMVNVYENYRTISSFWTFKKDGTWICTSDHHDEIIDTLATNNTCTAQYIMFGHKENAEGKWSFSADSNKRAIDIKANNFIFSYSPYEIAKISYRPYGTWTIIELREKEMKLGDEGYGYHGHLIRTEAIFKKK
jgi:hypothetical protein